MGSRTIYVDADASPVVRETIRLGRRHRTLVMLVGNETQNLARLAGQRGVETVEVGAGRDAADFAIAPRLRLGDIVVTADIGLAAIALGRSAVAISPRGRVYREATIEGELEIRHAEKKHRRMGGRTRGPAPFTDEDREHFISSLEGLLAR